MLSPRSRLQGIYPCSLQKIGACAPLAINIGVLLNSLRQDSDGRDCAGFNGHPDLGPAVNLLMQWESGGQSCLKIELFSGGGVVEFQKLGVQKISSIAGEAGEIFKRLAAHAVQRIAYQGMADGGQMNSDLMRAARMQAYLKCCGARVCCGA